MDFENICQKVLKPHTYEEKAFMCLDMRDMGKEAFMSSYIAYIRENKDKFIEKFKFYRKIVKKLNRIYGCCFNKVDYLQHKVNVFKYNFYFVIDEEINKDGGKALIEKFKEIFEKRNKQSNEYKNAKKFCEIFFKHKRLRYKVEEQYVKKMTEDLKIKEKFAYVEKEFTKGGKLKCFLFAHIFKQEKLDELSWENIEENREFCVLLIKNGLSSRLAKSFLKVINTKVSSIKQKQHDGCVIKLIIDYFGYLYTAKNILGFDLQVDTFFDAIQKELNGCFLNFTLTALTTKEHESFIREIQKKYPTYSKHIVNKVLFENDSKMIFKHKQRYIEEFEKCTMWEPIEKLKYKSVPKIVKDVEDMNKILSNSIDKIRYFKNDTFDHVEKYESVESLLLENDVIVKWMTDLSKVIEEDAKDVKDLDILKMIVFINNFKHSNIAINASKKQKDISEENAVQIFLFKHISILLNEFYDKEVFNTQMKLFLAKQLLKETLDRQTFVLFLSCLTEHQKYLLLTMLKEFEMKEQNNKFTTVITEEDKIAVKKEKHQLILHKKECDRIFEKYSIITNDVNSYCVVGSDMELDKLSYENVRKQKLLKILSENNKKKVKMTSTTCDLLLMKKCLWPRFESANFNFFELDALKTRINKNMEYDGIKVTFNYMMSSMTVKINKYEMKLNIAQFLLLKGILEKDEATKNKVLDIMPSNYFIKKQVLHLISKGIITGDYALKQLQFGDFTIKSSYYKDDVDDVKSSTDLHEISKKHVLQAIIIKRCKVEKQVETKIFEDEEKYKEAIEDLIDRNIVKVSDGYIKYVM